MKHSAENNITAWRRGGRLRTTAEASLNPRTIKGKRSKKRMARSPEFESGISGNVKCSIRSLLLHYSERVNATQLSKSVGCGIFFDEKKKF